ncbi:hypothetical protein JZU46_05245 [bacterium]|nr:hypothetical protein [bacterium]
MAKYNLIHNSFFTTTVASGIGNKSLSPIDLTTLTNGNTFIPVVSLVPSDTLCLDVDLTNRIKVDSILLYAEDLTKLSNIDFYYKNISTDSYSICTKSVLPTAYAAILPYPSAPRYIRCIISGVTLNLTEFFIFNEDSSIGFGEDGSETYQWLENTPIGYESETYEVPIFNNTSSDKATTAYACIDFSNSSADAYLELAENTDGPYVDLLGGTVYGHTNTDWNYGNLNNLTLDTNTSSLSITNKGSILTTYSGAVSSLPMSTCNYLGTPFGLRCSCWSYAEDLGAIFTFFYSGADQTNGTLNLYKYTLNTNTWTLVSLITIPSIAVYAGRVALVYNTGYIYYFFGNNAKTLYRYNLSGVQGNYEVLANKPNISYESNGENLILCSAGNYLFLLYNYIDGYYGRYNYTFFKYNISNNTWTSLAALDSLGNSTNYPWDRPMYLCYDPIRNSLYFMYSNSSLNIMRYDVAGNNWQMQFFDFLGRVSSTNTQVAMSYYSNKLYFTGYALGSKMYSYDVTTNIVSFTDISITFTNQNYNYLLVTAPQNNLDTVSAYIVRNFSLYGYNTTFGSPSVITTLVTAVGTFTSAVLALPDAFKTGYVLTNCTSTPGKNKIAKVGSLLENTIEIRSSDTAPQSIDEIYWALNLYGEAGSYITKYIVATDNLNLTWFTCRYDSNNQSYITYSTAVCRRTGRLFASYDYWNWTNSMVAIIDRQGGVIRWLPGVAPCYHGAYWGSNLNFWVYINSITLRSYTDSGANSTSTDVNNLYAYCAELDGTGAWYTDTNINALIRLNVSCVPQLTITLGRVYGVCSTEDNGCWVVDNDDPTYKYTVKRYNWHGVLQQIIPTERPLYRLTHDHASGFYARADIAIGEVYHYDNFGNMTMKVVNVATYEWLRGGRRGVVIHSPSISKIAYISLAEKKIVWEKTRMEMSGNTTNTSSYTPDIFSWDIVSERAYAAAYGSKLLPVAYDMVWGTALPWIEVPKDGYYLPHCRYHQVRVTLQNTDGTTSPTLNKMIISPVVAIRDILPQQSKPLYIRSNIPAEADGRQFNVRLKVWWSMDN